MSQIPIGWLMNRGACLAQKATGTDDRWYTGHRPLYFYQKDIVGSSSCEANFYTLWWKLTNVATENGPFVVSFPIQKGDYP